MIAYEFPATSLVLVFRLRGRSGFFQGGGINVVSIEHIPPKMFQFENLDLIKNYKYKQ